MLILEYIVSKVSLFLSFELTQVGIKLSFVSIY